MQMKNARLSYVHRVCAHTHSLFSQPISFTIVFRRRYFSLMTMDEKGARKKGSIDTTLPTLSLSLPPCIPYEQQVHGFFLLLTHIYMCVPARVIRICTAHYHQENSERKTCMTRINIVARKERKKRENDGFSPAAHMVDIQSRLITCLLLYCYRKKRLTTELSSLSTRR